jgi:hypothetical protein
MKASKKYNKGKFFEDKPYPTEFLLLHPAAADRRQRNGIL